jgi:hypothetical protein
LAQEEDDTLKLPAEAEDGIYAARVALSNAKNDTANWPFCGNSLAAASEYAVRAISVAWGDPKASMKKLSDFLKHPIGPRLEPHEIAFVAALWQYRAEKARWRPPEADQFVNLAEAIVEKLIQLAMQPVPDDWTPPSYGRISWDDLSDAERSFMNEVHDTAVRHAGPRARAYLHGSRAKGIATQQSDYDVYCVFPDDTDRIACGEVMTGIPVIASRFGVSVSGDYDFESEWRDPSRNKAPLIKEVKRYGIEVPSLPYLRSPAHGVHS